MAAQSMKSILLEAISNIPSPIYYSAALLGSIKVTSCMLNLCKLLYKNYIRQPLDLKSRYGKGSWALVTGGGQGLGEEYCYQLASLGFNILIIDKTDLAEKVAEIVQAKYQVQAKYIITDVSNIDLSIQKISQATQNLDISVIINNAGIIQKIHYFHYQHPDHIQQVININALFPIVLTSMFIPRLLQRNSQSAIIFVSSVSGINTIPFKQIYSATKSQLRAFACALAEEYKGKIDVVAQCPSILRTPMTQGFESFAFANPDESILGTFKALGRENQTIGASWHSLYYGGLESIYGKEGVVGKYNYRWFKSFINRQ